MDKSHIEKYKSEMMKLYGLRPQDEAETAKEDAPISAEINEAVEDIPEDTAYGEIPENDRDESSDDEDKFNQRYPEPDLSSLDTDSGELSHENTTPPEYSSEESLGDCKGYILANVRSGDESNPVEGASVSVTALIDGQRMMIASGLTDENGTTRKLEVPVPDAVHSQAPDPSIRPYSLYDVSVKADGFFDARSVDVPVFSGITSVQNFNMIPVPLMTSPSAETLVYYNKEPFPSGGEE
ncbi:MAG: carboxypeptidase regulatory-like domain-containing protein [Ruminococcus sp.]|nr:carboxypeptidase regulatory-like domain-containing protein [Ruminococcus sp.]